MSSCPGTWVARSSSLISSLCSESDVRVPLDTAIVEAAPERAVAAFTCYDIETAGAAIAAVGRRPLVLLVALRAFTDIGGDSLLAALCAVADAAPGPVAVQLDHCGE